MPYLPAKQFWCDITFFRNNMADMQRLYEGGVEMHSKCHDHYNHRPIIQHECSREIYRGMKMLEENNVYIGTFGLSGFLALSVAVASGYDEIYLLGYDFGTSSIKDKQTHYYQDDKIDYVSQGVRNPDVYMTDNGVKREVHDFDNYTNEKCLILNVSMKSNIQCFKKLTYEDFFRRIKQS
jgi:hypothetical protein